MYEGYFKMMYIQENYLNKTWIKLSDIEMNKDCKNNIMSLKLHDDKINQHQNKTLAW